MSTFSQDGNNAKATESSAPKDDATKEDIETADKTVEQEQVPADNPNEPTEILDESKEERADRHIASTELPVKEVTPPESQARDDIDSEFDTAPAADAGEKIVPGAASGPKEDGTVRNDQGKVAYAPHGSYNAAANGVQSDASGHVDSVGTDNSAKSGTRI